MDAHTQKTLDSILGAPAPRDIEWKQFIAMWNDLAEEVEQESGDRLAVRMNGHRMVFHRPHDGRVSIEDVERARHLLKKSPDPKGEGSVLAVVIDDKGARVIDFDLDTEGVSGEEAKVKDSDPRAHHLRTVERHTGRDDQEVLERFFDKLATELWTILDGRRFAVLGHGHGKADVADLFVERLRAKHGDVARLVAGVGHLDLSAATDADLESATKRIVQGS